ncbi:MAG: tetratricopeptide repeat protein [Chthoniobacter sp.]
MSKLDPLRQAVAVSPDNVPLLLLLAHACLDEWSLDEARSLFERVLTLDPVKPEARVGIARILHLSGKTSEAVVRIEALIAQHPQFAPAHLLLAPAACRGGESRGRPPRVMPGRWRSIRRARIRPWKRN